MHEPDCPTRTCPRRRDRRHYLCNACWRALPAETRGRLARHDAKAFLRLRQLHAALVDGTPLGIIRVSR